MENIRAGAYLSILIDLFPLMFLAFAIFFLKGLRGLRGGYMGASFFARFTNVVISSALGSALAVGCALLLPLFQHEADPMTMIGIVVFVSVAGVKVLDGIMYKKLGVHFLDISDSASADAEWSRLTQEEKHECLAIYRERVDERASDSSGL